MGEFQLNSLNFKGTGDPTLTSGTNACLWRIDLYFQTLIPSIFKYCNQGIHSYIYIYIYVVLVLVSVALTCCNLVFSTLVPLRGPPFFSVMNLVWASFLA